MSGPVSNFGQRRLSDIAARFTGYGTPLYLRVKTEIEQNAETKEYVQYGFQVSADDIPPTEDILVTPPAQVSSLSLRDIGLSMGKLEFGDKMFLISHTFVLKRQIEKDYVVNDVPDFERVFRDASVMGLFYGNALYKIVSAVHEDFGGKPWMWTLIGSAIQRPIAS